MSYGEAARKVELSKKQYQNKLTRNDPYTIRFLKNFQNHIDSDILSKIYENDVVFTARSKKIKLPKELTPEIAYYFGYLQGDGCLTSDRKGLSFADEYRDQIDKMSELSKRLFGDAGKIYEKVSKNALKPAYCLEVKSIVLCSFFNVVFGLNLGKKKNMKIPEIIGRDKVLCRYYLAGLFDADGTLPKNPEKSKQLFIDITMKDRLFIEAIKEKITEFGIHTYKVYERTSRSEMCNSDFKTYEIRIRRKSALLRFLKEVGFLHPNKAIRAQKMVRLLEGPVAQPG